MDVCIYIATDTCSINGQGIIPNVSPSVFDPPKVSTEEQVVHSMLSSEYLAIQSAALENLSDNVEPIDFTKSNARFITERMWNTLKRIYKFLRQIIHNIV